MAKRSLTIAGHRTSISLEDPFWEALAEIAAARRLSVAAARRLHRPRPPGGNQPLRRDPASRLDWYRKQAKAT